MIPTVKRAEMLLLVKLTCEQDTFYLGPNLPDTNANWEIRTVINQKMEFEQVLRTTSKSEFN